MKLVSALAGVIALGGVALASAAASATPINVEGVGVPAGYIEWGHCWHLHYDGGYYRPHYWHRYGNWHRPWRYAYGDGWRWHHWHHWQQW